MYISCARRICLFHPAAVAVIHERGRVAAQSYGLRHIVIIIRDGSLRVAGHIAVSVGAVVVCVGLSVTCGCHGMGSWAVVVVGNAFFHRDIADGRVIVPENPVCRTLGLLKAVQLVIQKCLVPGGIDTVGDAFNVAVVVIIVRQFYQGCRPFTRCYVRDTVIRVDDIGTRC